MAVALTTLSPAETGAQAALILVPKGAGWRYLDNGSDQENWKELWYNDDSWGFGHAELGYGEAIT